MAGPVIGPPTVEQLDSPPHALEATLDDTTLATLTTEEREGEPSGLNVMHRILG